MPYFMSFIHYSIMSQRESTSSSESDEERDMVPDIAAMPEQPEPTNWNSRRMMERPRFRDYRGGDYPNQVWTPSAPSSPFAPVPIRAPGCGSVGPTAPELPDQSGYVSPGYGSDNEQIDQGRPSTRRPVGLCTWLDLSIMEIRVSRLPSYYYPIYYPTGALICN